MPRRVLVLVALTILVALLGVAMLAGGDRGPSPQAELGYSADPFCATCV